MGINLNDYSLNTIVVWFMITVFFPTLIYFLWMCYDWKTCHQGGRRWNLTRNLFFWNILRDCAGIKLIKTVSLDPRRNYICGYHPHGLLAVGALCNFGTEATTFSGIFPTITPYVLTHDILYWIPILREILLTLGLSSASKKSFNHILTKKGSGNAIIVVVGGLNEAFDTTPNMLCLKLKDRKGFVRHAIKYGADLVPILTFGENELFQLPLNSESIFDLNTIVTYILGYCPPKLFIIRILKQIFNVAPERKPMYTVVGKPITVAQNRNPGEDMIDNYHNQYIQSLQQLFEEYKTRFGDDYKDMNFSIR